MIKAPPCQDAMGDGRCHEYKCGHISAQLACNTQGVNRRNGDSVGEGLPQAYLMEGFISILVIVYDVILVVIYINKINQLET